MIEEEREEVPPIEVVAAAMGGRIQTPISLTFNFLIFRFTLYFLLSTPSSDPGAEIETPREEVDVPALLDEVHGVPTLLAQDEAPKALFEDSRIPETVDAQLAIPGTVLQSSLPILPPSQYRRPFQVPNRAF